MPCYSPLRGFKAKVPGKSGRRGIVFNPKDGFPDLPIEVPCGKCIGCRMAKAKEWSIRIVHEASCFDKNSFITLTYDDEHLPYDGGLNVQHFQKFMKRLRFELKQPIRFFHCGEYGDKLKRPHYHAIIFGWDFPDKKIHSEKGGHKVYVSEQLTRLWPFGFSTVGSVTTESANYVARYTLKKVTGDAAENAYTRVDPETGEAFKVSPEYVTMSRMPGIGNVWYQQYKDDCYPKDFVTDKGKKFPIPRYYDRQLEKEDPDLFETIKAQRTKKAKKRSKDTTPERLAVREQIAQLNQRKLMRTVE